MKNLNACLASLNLGLPDDVRRLKEAGYYTEAIARIDAYLAEDWTKMQNQPVQPGGPLPENPTPHGVDAMRDALLAQREILRRLPLDYTVPEAQALELLQDLVRDFTPEEFRALDRAGAMDWRFVEGEKRYIRSFAETLLATVRSTRPCSTPAGSGMSRSTSRWCAPARSARTSRWKPASA